MSGGGIFDFRFSIFDWRRRHARLNRDAPASGHRLSAGLLMSCVKRWRRRPLPLEVARPPRAGVAYLNGLLSLVWLAFAAGAMGQTNVAWRWERTLVPRALFVEGIWAEHFRAVEALDKAGLCQDSDLGSFGAARGRYSIVVLANVSTVKLPAACMDAFRDFVRNGGGLVVLGGLSAYGNAQYAGTPLEEMLPVSLAGSYIDHFPTAPGGALLAPAKSSDWTWPPERGEKPLAYYFHALAPKDGAKVQVVAGSAPAFVTGSFGRGRVVACALTVNGDPRGGALGFWDWKEWPALLAQAMDWAAGARPPGNDRPADKVSGIAPLTEDEISSMELGLDELPRDGVKRALAHPGERTAAALLKLAAPGKGEPKCSLAKAMPALLPYARPDWGATLRPLADDTNPDMEMRKAALSLLGASRAESAFPILAKALNDPRSELAAMDGLWRLGGKEGLPLLTKRFNSAVQPARLRDAPDRWDPAGLANAAQPAAYAAIALYRLGDPEGVPRVFTLFRDIELYHRIFRNAGRRQVRAEDAQGLAILKKIWGDQEKLRLAEEYMRESIGPIPESQRDAFVAYARRAGDPVEVDLMARAIEQSAAGLPAAAWQALSGAKSGIIARIARNVIELGRKK